MSEQRTPPGRQDKRQAKKTNSRIWLGISLGLTTIIMTWAFSLPFRSGGLSFADKESRDGSASGVGASGADMPIAYDDAEAFRAAAVALDEEFMRARQERNRLKEVPGAAEAKVHWQQHVEKVKQSVRELGNPEEGSLEWQEREELIESLEDAPL